MEMTIELAKSIIDWTITAIIVIVLAWSMRHFPVWTGGFSGAIASAYVAKLARYRLDRWKNPIVMETESGRPPHYEVILRKEAPSIISTPSSHIFLPWWVVVGWVDKMTGSVSVTRSTIAEVKQFDKLRHEMGTNETVSRQVNSHLFFVRERLNDAKDELQQHDLDILETINRVTKFLKVASERDEEHRAVPIRLYLNDKILGK